jgi:hypothetical protein
MKKLNSAEVPTVALPEINVNAASTLQKIKYPCGCELVGPAPMGKDCPTHGASSTKPSEMLVSVILDESGSMESCRQQTINGYNEYLNGLKKDGNPYLISLSKFDSNPGDVTCRIQYTNQPIDKAPQLTMETFVPRGGTPLYDAIGKTVTELAPTVNGRPVVVIIMTDGGENSSNEFDNAKVKALIKAKEAEGNWTFVYLGANQDAWAVGASFGMAAGNTMSYQTANTKNVFQNLVGATMMRSATFSTTGQASTSCYFADAGVTDVNIDTQAVTSAAYLGSLGGKARAANQTPQERSKLAKRAVTARESKKSNIGRK